MMKASLQLEYIGANSFDAIRGVERMLNSAAPGLGSAFIGEIPTGPYVAEITWDQESMRFLKTPLTSQRDYRHANGKGSRGVMLRFILKSDQLYEVYERISWRRSDTYFVAVSEYGTIYRLKDHEVKEWLNTLSA